MEPQGALESPQGSTKDPAKASMEILSVTWNTPTQSLCNVTQRPFPSLLGTIPQNLRLPPWPPSPPMVRPAPQGEGLTRQKREKKFVCQKFVCLFWSQNQHKPTCTQTFFLPGAIFVRRHGREEKFVWHHSPKKCLCAHRGRGRAKACQIKRLGPKNKFGTRPPGARFPRTQGVPQGTPGESQRTHAGHSMDSPPDKNVHPWRGQQNKTRPPNAVLA